MRIHVIQATTDPAVAPSYVGQHYINTSNSKHWLAKGTSSVSDWVLFTADTDTGITQLTGDVTAGPGSGSQAATLASIGTAGTYVKVTTDAKGRVTAGVASPLPIADGGFGQSMTMQTDSSNGAHNTLPAGLVKMTGTTSVVINGIVAPAVSVLTYIYNGSASAITINHQSSSASAANRIITMTTGTQSILSGMRAMLFYDTGVSRWILLSINSITSATLPLSISATGAMSMTQSGVGADGYLSSTNFNVFNGKVGGSGASNRVAYWTGGLTQSSNVNFSWNDPLNQFGVGLNSTQTAASIDAYSNTGTGLADLGGFSASLIPFPLPTSPNISVSQTTPEIQSPSMTGMPSDIGSGLYTGGDVIDYVITAGFDNGMDPILWGVSSFAIAGVTDGSDFDIDISIAPGTENLATNIWSIARQVNGGGYNDYLRTTFTTFTDTNTGWGGGPDDLSNKADDFLSTGIDYSGLILAYGTKTTPISTTVIAASPNDPVFMDDNSGFAYKMNVQFTGATNTPYRLAWPNTRTYDTSGDFISGPIGPTSNGAPDTTPTTYGYTSDGSILSRSFDGYSKNASPTIYSANALSSNTVDPNDAQNYFIQIGLSGGGGSLTKVIRDSSVSETVAASTTFYDDGVTSFGGDTTITPTTLYVPAGRFAQHGASVNDSPALVIKSIDGSYGRLDFWSNGDSLTGYLENQSGTMTMRSGSTGARVTASSTQVQIGSPALTSVINVTNSLITLAGPTTVANDLTVSTHNIVTDSSTGTQVATATSQKLAFHGSTPVAQRSGSAQAAVATTAATNVVPYGFTTQAQADALVTLVNEIRATLVQKGLFKGSA